MRCTFHSDRLEVDFLRGGGYHRLFHLSTDEATPMLLLAFSLLSSEPSVSDQVASMASDFQPWRSRSTTSWWRRNAIDAKVSEANRVYQRNGEKAAEEVQTLVKRHPDDPAALDGILLLTGEMRLDARRRADQAGPPEEG